MKIGDFSFPRKSNLLKITDKVEKLTELKNLFEGGFINQDEFNQLKAEITGILPIEHFKTVSIGNQIWMVDNLNVSNFQNGDKIPEVKSNTDWQKAGNERKPAWCYLNNDTENGKEYGKLYNWYAVNDHRDLAPKGWHVATHTEWKVLVNYLMNHGYSCGPYLENIAKSMAATWGWLESDSWEPYQIGCDLSKNNSSGFTALPGGLRRHEGSFSQVKSMSGFWCEYR